MVKRLVVVLALAAVFVTGCGFFRDLSSPATRLVGHWTTDKGIEYYFGSQIAGKGTVIVLPKGQPKETYTYEVIEEDQEADTVTIEITLADDSVKRMVFRIPEDGLFMREQSEPVADEEKTDYIFVDVATTPAPYDQTRQAGAEE